jgi:hypothetical protein
MVALNAKTGKSSVNMLESHADDVSGNRAGATPEKSRSATVWPEKSLD